MMNKKARGHRLTIDEYRPWYIFSIQLLQVRWQGCPHTISSFRRSGVLEGMRVL
jgi:hypothetical protein